MSVLVDTSIWSLALRRSASLADDIVAELRSLIEESRVQMIGPIRQELLSGIRVPEQYERLREQLRSFPDLELSTADYERAAEYFNLNRSRGVQGSNTDFLICAVAIERDLSIFTTDRDFESFQKHIPIQLHTTRSESS